MEGVLEGVLRGCIGGWGERMGGEGGVRGCSERVGPPVSLQISHEQKYQRGQIREVAPPDVR